MIDKDTFYLLNFSYYVVHPIVNPASEFVILENLQVS